jgi:predicted CopG family antitoxin
VRIKKKTRNILLITLAPVVAIFFYGKHNFDNDRRSFREVVSLAGAGDVSTAFTKMKERKSFSNPIVKFIYQRWKKKMYARFVSKEEVFENTSGNKIVNEISNIYREYWRVELMKPKPESRTDSALYNNIADYVLSNKLTRLSKDSLRKNIKDDTVLKKIIEQEGFKVNFNFRNGFQEIFIWNKESTEKYDVILPKETIKTTVVFIESYHINGYDEFATIGDSQVGGWATKDSTKLYCNKGTYDLKSEKFKISYLKHESLHFTDLNNYPNLSAADLEYRSKVIELMYCTEGTIYDRISEFVSGANKADRKNSHPYANYILIQNLSKLIFNSDFNSDSNQWKKVSVDKINKAASSLYESSENILQKDNSLNEII